MLSKKSLQLQCPTKGAGCIKRTTAQEPRARADWGAVAASGRDGNGVQAGAHGVGAVAARRAEASVALVRQEPGLVLEEAYRVQRCLIEAC